jgi:nifR3 family TIM-barrel protein
MIRIGSSVINTRAPVAPMAGCTDLPLRLISRENGARFAFFEMVDSNSIIYGNSRKTISILKSVEADHPIAAQLLGEDPHGMLKSAKRILELSRPIFIDINAACPVKKAVKKKAGAYLIRAPKTLACIVKTLASALPVPVTVKLRAGYDKIYPEEMASIAKSCESSGASAIFVHGRTRSAGYSGPVDYTVIRAIKETVKVPVIGSGDIFSVESAKKMIDETYCDGVLVARGSLGNPWLSKQIDDYLTNGKMPDDISAQNRLETLKRHLAYVDLYRDSNPAGKVGYMRKVAMWYIKKFIGSSRIRRKISLVKTYDEMLKLLDVIEKDTEA